MSNERQAAETPMPRAESILEFQGLRVASHLQLRLGEGRAGRCDAVGRQRHRCQIHAPRPGRLGSSRRRSHQRHLRASRHMVLSARGLLVR